MKTHKIKQILSVLLCSCFFVPGISGCSRESDKAELPSIPVNQTDNNDSIVEKENSLSIGNLWRETTEKEILDIYGEILNIPEEAENVSLRYLESEHLAELTFIRDGFSWIVRIKPTESMEDISGLYYDWDYESEVQKFSTFIDYIGEPTGPEVMRIERKVLQYAQNGVYIGVALWFSKEKGLKYSTSYIGGDYTDFNISSEVIEDLWPWTHEKSGNEAWDSVKWAFDENNIAWPFGEGPDEIVLSETDTARQYEQMADLVSLNNEGNFVYSPLQFESIIAALAEGTNGNTRENLCNYLGRGLEEERRWIKSLRYYIPSSMIMYSFLRYPGTFNGYYNEATTYAATAYTVEYTAEGVGSLLLEDTVSNNIYILSNGALNHVTFPAIPDEKSLLGDGITYFHPRWAEPYDDSQVGQMSFTNDSGEIESVLGMISTENCFFENEKASGFMKNLEEERYAFVGILPKEQGVFDLENLRIEELLATMQQREVQVIIPEIVIDETVEVSSAFETIGIEGLMDEDVMDHIIDDNSFTVSSVNLSTTLRIDPAWQQPFDMERISENTLTISSDNELSIVLDRPFVFMIMDTQTGQVMLGGIVRSMQ